MSNRRTNFEKLVRWDADWYKLLSDDDCVICVTEKEVYLIGQIVEMLRWKNTRWVGNLVGLNFDDISEALEYKLAERMSCTSISDLVNKITQLEQKIDYIFNNDIAENNGYMPTANTAPYDRYTPSQMDTEFSYATDGCDTADKDALYSGVREFVNYVHANNTDALEVLGQGFGAAQQAERLISGIPVLGLLPIDEIVGYTAFLADELKDEYEATVDEALLETVTCELFCIAVNSDCTFNYSDAVNYFGSKISGGAIDLFDDLANVVQFALTGTFSGDDYFYFMCVFQFIAVAVADHYFDVDGINSYILRVATGANSPDNDWSILCDACPTHWRLWKWDFQTQGVGEWYPDYVEGAEEDNGEFVAGEGWMLGDFSTGQRAELAMLTDTSWRIRAMAIEYSDAVGELTGKSFSLRPTAQSLSGISILTTSGAGQETYNICRDGLQATAPYEEVGIGLQHPSQGEARYIRKVAIVFYADGYKPGSVITEDSTLCS